MNKIIILILLAIITFSESIAMSDITYSEAIKLANQQFVDNKDNEKYLEYFSVWGDFNNENKMDEIGNCYEQGKDKVYMVIIIGETGVIEQVVSYEQSDKASCFERTYTGKVVPKPPIAPFYIRATMN